MDTMMDRASEPAFARLVGHLARVAGLSFPAHRAIDVENATGRQMRLLGYTRLDDYVDALVGGTAPIDPLLDELTVGETYFFRNARLFEQVRRELLPAVRARRGATYPVRIWSAGCASGEEAWSLAMITAESPGRFAPVLATDLSAAALRTAEAGRYRAWSMRGEGAAAALRFLERDEGSYRIPERLRERVQFRQLNLAGTDWPSRRCGPYAMDLIVCCNVLIYLDEATVARVARRLRATLASGGWLVTSPSDPPLEGLATGLDPIPGMAGRVYRRPMRRTTRRLAQRPTPPRVEVGKPPEPPASLPSLVDLATHAAHAVPPTTIPVSRAGLDTARSAFQRGDYQRARSLAALASSEVDADPEIAAFHVHAVASTDGPEAAEAAAATACARFPTAPELHYLRAVLLVGIGRHDDAAVEARRVLYLDPSLAVAQLMLGGLLRRRGDRTGARRAYREASTQLANEPPDAQVPLGEGERAGALAQLARVQLTLLDEEDRT